MKILSAPAILFLLLPAVAEPRPATKTYTDPVALLQAVAKTYAANPKTFRIESIEESVQTSPYEHDWRKTDLTAIKVEHGVFRIEARGPAGSWTMVSDGIHQWLYESNSKVYVEQSAGHEGPIFPKVFIAGMMDLSSAWSMLGSVEMKVSNAQDATMLPAQTIRIEGQKYPCYVVHTKNVSSDPGFGTHTNWEDTFWIDKRTLVIRKTVEQRTGFLMESAVVHTPAHWDITTLYPMVELHPQLEREAFNFVPPAGTKRMPDLESLTQWPKPAFQAMVGKPMPDVTLVNTDGKKVNLSSYHGKPLLIDLWATWCGPCIAGMPGLDRIYQEVKGKGLAMITVDYDRTAATAAAYLAKHKYTWTNFHDPKHVMSNTLHEGGIPLTLLVNAQGKVVYEDFGGHDAALRKAISKLGPQFASLAPATAAGSKPEPMSSEVRKQ